ncbi:MAG: peptidase S41 [Gammaproteobacteria bacterium]|nr:peptidase S41 [Gammaproteobacteria bacterium]|tara:strand:- start:9828 stop:11162 length:1335 start_codon:yes stop_codon:yes gene_type:complete
MKTTLLQKTLILLLSILPMLSAQTLYAQTAANGDADGDAESNVENLPLPLNEVRIFAEVLNRIRSAYVEPIDDQTLLENAVRGMLAGIDPHSSYLANEAFDLLQENTTGEFGGLGVEVGISNGFITIISPVDGSPADVAGIQAGDIVIKIDDTPTTDITIEETTELMRGEPGTDVVLTVLREGVDEAFEITVTRDVIRSRSVRSRFVEPGFGYVRISQFVTGTGDEVVTALENLHLSSTDLKGIILDLRNNPGGVLQAAVDVVDAFITEGLIVYTEGREDSAFTRYEATSADPSQGVPMIVLINQGSASASEVVAGALQDHGRAVIMGTQSFGKGSVQTVLPLTNDRAIKLTTALYYTPNGRSIQARGITPNIIVRQGRVTSVPDNLAIYREQDLAGHLENNDDPELIPDAIDLTREDVIVRDYQLNEALNILKGIALMQTRRL